MIRKEQLITRHGQIIQDKNEHFTDSMNEEGYRFPAHKAGARLFDDVRFPSGMSHAEIGRMTFLSILLIGQTNLLGYRRGRNIYSYTAQEIGELVDLSGSRARAFVSRMCFLRIMQRVITTSGPQYYISPAYFMASGHRLSLDLFLLFRKDLALIIPRWVMNEFLSLAHDKEVSVEALNADNKLAVEIAERIIKEGQDAG